jgi:Domain of unknown function (DUF932)
MDFATPSIHSNAFGSSISLDSLRQRAPAVFSSIASPRTKHTYRFIGTESVLHALIEAGFEVSAALQTRSRAGSDPNFARHMLRLRVVRERISLIEALPEVCLVNSHAGDTAYTLIAGLYRPLCTNGLLCRIGDFGLVRVPHRTSVITDVVAGALEIVSQFGKIGATVEAMAARTLSAAEQLDLARVAFSIRWAKVDVKPSLDPAQLLQVRRSADDYPTLWHCFNRIQEAVMAGGLHYQTSSRRQVTTRRIRNIREDIRVNTALWQAAVGVLEG